MEALAARRTCVVLTLARKKPGTLIAWKSNASQSVKYDILHTWIEEDFISSELIWIELTQSQTMSFCFGRMRPWHRQGGQREQRRARPAAVPSWWPSLPGPSSRCARTRSSPWQPLCRCRPWFLCKMKLTLTTLIVRLLLVSYPNSPPSPITSSSGLSGETRSVASAFTFFINLSYVLAGTLFSAVRWRSSKQSKALFLIITLCSLFKKN